MRRLRRSLPEDKCKSNDESKDLERVRVSKHASEISIIWEKMKYSCQSGAENSKGERPWDCRAIKLDKVGKAPKVLAVRNHEG